jgi:pimeloyl-ACP methyl ester carboxylesterase
MRRFSALIVVLVLVASMTGGVPRPSAAQEATPSPTVVAKAQQPAQPTTGPGSSEALFGSVSVVEQIPPGEIEPDYWLFAPSDPLSGATVASEPRPLVIVIHGYTLRDSDPYLGWIEHLVRRGAVVLYPEYQEDATEDTAYRQNLLDDVRDALGTLQDEGIAADLTQVAVTGHSLGGALAVDYAASAAAAGLPTPAVVMSVAPGCIQDLACLVADLAMVPATTRVLVVTDADDSDPSGGGAVERIWGGLSAVPLEQRDLVTLVSDTHGIPWLLATHEQVEAYSSVDATAGTDVANALDWYGTWKWLDALMACAFDGEWCEHALGDTPEQRFMGEWSDGVPVAEAEVTDAPE